MLPEFLISSRANQNSISDERDYYAVREKQKENQFWGDEGYYRIIQPGIRNHYLGPDLCHVCPFTQIESRRYN